MFPPNTAFVAALLRYVAFLSLLALLVSGTLPIAAAAEASACPLTLQLPTALPLKGTVVIAARATAAPPAVVVFRLAGPRSAANSERFAPYHLFGSTRGQPHGWDTRDWPDGRYTVTATGYRQGRCGEARATFLVANHGTTPQPVACAVRLNVVPAAVLSGNVVLRAHVAGQPNAVRFDLSGPRAATHIEYGEPYTLFGGQHGVPFGWDTRDWPNGAYTLDVTALRGAACGAATVRFTVANAVAPPPTPSPVVPPAPLRTFTPLPLSATVALTTPLAGLFQGYDRTAVPGTASSDVELRVTWRDLEPQPGVYDFTAIEGPLAAAAAQGRRAAVRVRAEVAGAGVQVPDALVDAMPEGWWLDWDDNGAPDTYVPDWNDPDFVLAHARLVAAFAERYDGDPRLAWVELGSYGLWGDWHTASHPYPAPSGANAASDATLRALIDAYLVGFMHTQLVMPAGHPVSLHYALQESPTIGWHGEGLGTAAFAALAAGPAGPLLRDRWQTAPVLATLGPPGTPPAAVLAQAAALHVTMVTAQTTTSWDTLTPEDQQLLITLARQSGARLSLQQLTLPATLVPGQAFVATAAWANSGTAPLYDPWTARLALCDAAGTVVATWDSALDLRMVLPVADQPHTVAEQWTLPETVAVGVYTVTVQVAHARGELAPLPLAQEGRTTDGTYTLGTLTVAAAPTPTPVPPTPTSELPTPTPVPPTPTSELPTPTSEPVPPAGSAQQLAPAILADDTPIIAPMRGLYQWRGSQNAPVDTRDAYQRYTWKQLENREGAYTFDVIDRDIAAAAREGRAFAFRVRAMSEGEDATPDYLKDRLAKGWWKTRTFADWGEQRTYVPDWNDRYFLERARKLMEALGERYDGDGRIAYVDIGMYGNWGEWHTHAIYPSPNGAVAGTDATRHALIDAHIDAFPHTQLLMLTEDEQSLVYALRQSPTIGMRRDSFGTAHFHDKWQGDFRNLDDAGRALVRQRWQTAPLVVEYWGAWELDDPESYELGVRDVARDHISLIGNGNADGWSGMSRRGRAAYLQAGQQAGYRLTLPAVAVLVGAGRRSLEVEATWANRSVAPLYRPASVRWQLRRGDTVVAELPSTIVLRDVLPGSYRHTDLGSLPAGLAAGSYTLAVQVSDAQGFYGAIPLALQGRQDDGSYVLGTVVLP